MIYFDEHQKPKIMLKLDLPFHLTERLPGTFLRSSVVDFHQPRANKVVLEGLSITIETRRKVYAVSSDGPPQADHPGRCRGAIWPRACWPLADGMSIEQQMLLPAEGNALAISWRLIGHSLLPVRLRVSPVFSAYQPFSPAGFEGEPDSNGGRLAWRPHHRFSKIIADTNGCFSGKVIPAQSSAVPASFEFNLGPHPAILILSTEPQSAVDTDPVIGAFLAHLSEQGATPMDCNHQRDLAAA